MKNTLPASVRLKRRSDFVRVQSSERKVHTKHFLVALDSAGSAGTRLGITVTKKIAKRATVRNRIKRCIREFFRHNRFRLHSNFDIVVIARRGANERSCEEIARELFGAFRKGGLIT